MWRIRTNREMMERYIDIVTNIKIAFTNIKIDG